MSIDTYLTIALAASSIVAVGIALSIAGRLLVTVPTYAWRLMTGTLSATDRSPQRVGDARRGCASRLRLAHALGKGLRGFGPESPASRRRIVGPENHDRIDLGQ
jgi:hypothetical protein